MCGADLSCVGTVNQTFPKNLRSTGLLSVSVWLLNRF